MYYTNASAAYAFRMLDETLACGPEGRERRNCRFCGAYATREINETVACGDCFDYLEKIELGIVDVDDED